MLVYYAYFDDFLNGLWVATPKFLNQSNLSYMAIDFNHNSKTALVFITDLVNKSTIQEYKYNVDNSEIIFTANNIPDNEIIIPNKKLTMEIDKDNNRILMYYGDTIYLDIIKV